MPDNNPNVKPKPAGPLNGERAPNDRNPKNDRGPKDDKPEDKPKPYKPLKDNYPFPKIGEDLEFVLKPDRTKFKEAAVQFLFDYREKMVPHVPLSVQEAGKNFYTLWRGLDSVVGINPVNVEDDTHMKYLTAVQEGIVNDETGAFSPDAVLRGEDNCTQLFNTFEELAVAKDFIKLLTAGVGEPYITGKDENKDNIYLNNIKKAFKGDHVRIARYITIFTQGLQGK